MTSIKKIEKMSYSTAIQTSKKVKQFYRDAYEQVINELEHLFFKNGFLTRSEVYRLRKLRLIKVELELAVENELAKSLEQIAFNTTSMLGLSLINESEVQTLVNRTFCGSNYSERIWKDTEQLITQIQEDLGRMVSTGYSTDKLKSNLMRRFNTSYHNADRLIRTESNRVFNDSALLSYHKAGITKVKVLDADDERECIECQEVADKEYLISEVPALPIHPNCRCCYAPIIT